MPIIDRIEGDLKFLIKKKDKTIMEAASVNALKVIVGEMQRGQTKNPSDDEVIVILKKLKKGEKELLEAKKLTQSLMLDVIEMYLPEEVTEQEIEAYIEGNDFVLDENRIKYMKQIMNHFRGRADGKLVREVLMRL